MPLAQHSAAMTFPPDEISRVEKLRMLGILDTAAEPAFDALVRTASLVCGCPISLMSLIDTDRQWFKSAVGIDATETPREQAFCAHAIQAPDALFEVPDALRDERFVANPLVTGGPQIRFYAGQPIVFDGAALGTLCVIDRVPRNLDDDQRAMLRHLSTAMAELLQGRLDAILHRREAERLQAFARLSGDWLWETDAAACCTWLSGDASKAAPLFEGPIPGTRFVDTEVRDWMGIPIGATRLHDLFAAGSSFCDAVVEMAAPGGPRFACISGEPIADRPGSFRGSARDVTVQVRAERDVRERERLLRKIAAHVPGVIYQYRSFDDGRACFPYASEGAHDVWELAPGDVRDDAAALFARIHRDDLARVRRSGRVSRQEGTIWHARFRVVLPTKGVRWLEGSSMPERLPDGSTLWHGIVTDVTESHARDREFEAANAALQDAQRRLIAVTDNLPALVSYIDRDLRYRFVNAHHERIYGGDGRSILGRTMQEVRGALYSDLEPHVAAVLGGRRVSFEGSTVLDGALQHFQCSFVPDKDANGAVRGFYAMTFDLTARRNAELKLIRSERLLLDITNNIPAVIGEFDLDGHCLFANDLALESHGRTHADLGTLTFRSPMSDEHYAQLAPGHAAVLAGRSSVVHGVRVVDGDPRWFTSHFVPSVDAAGVQRGFYVTTFDVTMQKQAEVERAMSEQRLRRLTDNLPVMISTIDTEERMTYANETLRAWVGSSIDEMVGRTVLDAIGPALYAQRSIFLKRCLAGERVSFEIDSPTESGMRHLETTYLPDHAADGHVVGITTLTVDVTERTVAERRLSQLAHTDALTGLPNRLRFNDEIGRILETDECVRPTTAIMFLDVDRFKTINDTHGHAVGDGVLKEFAHRVRGAVRPTDFVARLAGDEFVIVLQGVRPEEVPRIAAKIVEEVGRPFRVDDRALNITTSIGVAFRERDTTAADFLARADVALYRAKDEGRNTFRLAA